MLGSQNGQSLIEMVIALGVGVITIAALTFAAISGIRNAQFANNQAVATKLAQEGVEKVKNLRDRDEASTVSYFNQQGTQSTGNFSSLWGEAFSCQTPSNCQFTLAAASPTLRGHFNEINPQETVGQHKRQIQIEDLIPGDTTKKKVTVIVEWDDSSGDHESKLTTILTKQ